MMGRPTAAKGSFPYPHRTCADWMIFPAAPVSAPEPEFKPAYVAADPPPLPVEPYAETGLPPSDVWILGYFPHARRTGGVLSRFNGWFPCRARHGDYGRVVWTAQMGANRLKMTPGFGPKKWALMRGPHELDRYIGRTHSSLPNASVFDGAGL